MLYKRVGIETLKYSIRELKAKDIISVNKMYDSRSNKDTVLFQSGFLGLNNINLRRLCGQIILFISIIRPLRRLLLKIHPKNALLPLVAVANREVIGFAYLKILDRLYSKRVTASLGIIVKDEYKGRGIGSKLMEKLIEFGHKETIEKISLTVLVDNSIAIYMYKKYGFEEKEITKEDRCGRLYDVMEMELSLREVEGYAGIGYRRK